MPTSAQVSPTRSRLGVKRSFWNQINEESEAEATIEHFSLDANEERALLEQTASANGIVIGTRHFSRRMHLNDDQKKQLKQQMEEFIFITSLQKLVHGRNQMN